MFGAEMAKLIAAGIPADVAAPGTEMPDGDLLDAHGWSTTLTVARDGKPAMAPLFEHYGGAVVDAGGGRPGRFRVRA